MLGGKHHDIPEGEVIFSPEEAVPSVLGRPMVPERVSVTPLFRTYLAVLG
jgi:hypothetical protein